MRAHFYLVPFFRIPYTKEHAVTTPQCVHLPGIPFPDTLAKLSVNH